MTSSTRHGHYQAFFIVTIAFLQSTLAVELDRAILQPVVIPEESSGSCPPEEVRQAAIERIRNDVKVHLNNSLQMTPLNEYCGHGQWHRVAYVNMTNPQQNCPPEWREYTSNNVRGCGRAATCSGTTFTTGLQYNKVCGRVIAYQVSSTDAFRPRANTIDNNYVDGVSVTHGNPRNHIWTFAGEVSHDNSDIYNCPCSDSPNASPPPSFVGNNYFCESANTDHIFRNNHLYTNDKLWDGEQCRHEGTCCTDKSPPWFTVDLPTSTSDDIEVRICGDESLQNENTPIELLEIYIQ